MRVSGAIESAALVALMATGLPVTENAPFMPYAQADGGWTVESCWVKWRGITYRPRYTEGGSDVRGQHHSNPEGAIEEIRQILVCRAEGKEITP